MNVNVNSRVARPSGSATAAILLTLIGVGTLAQGCAEHGAKPSHLDIADSSSPQLEDEWLSQQRLVRLKRLNADGTVTESQVDVGGLVGPIVQTCLLPNVPDPCDQEFNEHTKKRLCMTRTALALATAQSDPMVLTVPSATYKYVIDQVSEANAAQLAIYASEFGRRGIRRALKFLNVENPSQCGTAGSWRESTGTPGRSSAVDYASAVVELYYLTQAAVDRAVEASINVADKSASGSVSYNNVRDRSILSPQLSRAAAAHLLVGGADGILGVKDSNDASADKAYCLSGDLNQQSREALEILRQASPKPSVLLDSAVGIDAFLNGTVSDGTVAGSGGSVRQRLGEFYSIPKFKNSSQSLESYYGISQNDFSKARDYFRSEVSVLNRSLSALGNVRSSATGYYRYGGTSGDAPSLPAGAWSARARYLTTHSVEYDDSGNFLISPFGDLQEAGYYTNPNFRPSPLDTFIAGVNNEIRKVLSSPRQYELNGVPQSAEVHGVLSTILTGKAYKGALELTATTSSIRGLAFGYTAADKVRIMVGEDGLRCALTSTVEGAPCDDALTGALYNKPMTGSCLTAPATFSCLTAQVLTGQTSSTLYGQDVATGSAARTGVVTSDLIANKTRLYFVKLKPGLTVEKPGNYELIAGAPLLLNQWTIIPVVPHLDARVADILAPNPKNCATPKVNCLGKAYDARLPLEDELSSDGDNVENSWRHYLELARQAAEESDFLGREFRDAKLNKLQGDAATAQRQEEKLRAAEDALEEVQAACGTAIDSRKLLNYFSGLDGKSELDAVAINPGGAGCPTVECPSSDMVCMAGKCVKDPAKLTAAGSPFENDADAKRLVECIGTDAKEAVTLGDDPVCAWVPTGKDAPLCPSTLPIIECPTPKPSTGCKTYSNHTSVTARPLGYFEPQEPETTINPCVELRKARKLRSPDTVVGSARTAYGNVRNSEVFIKGRLSETVAQLGYHAKFGGFFDITEGSGVTRWSSGNLEGKRGTGSWPHTLPGECSPDQTGLFCTSWSLLSNDLAFGRMNERAFKAVWAAAAIREEMNPSLHAVPLTFVTKGEWAVRYPTKTQRYIGDDKWQITEERAAFDGPFYMEDFGARLLYTYPQKGMSPASVLMWIKPDGTTIDCTKANGCKLSGSPGGAPFHFDGPVDPNREKTRDLGPVLDFTRQTGKEKGFIKHAFAALRGEVEEKDEAGIGIEARQAELLRHIWDTGGKASWLDTGALLDGLELLCELDRAHTTANGALIGTPTTPAESEQMAQSIGKLGEELSRNASLLVFDKMPTIVANALDQAHPNGDQAALGGDLAVAIADIKSALEKIKGAIPIMAGEAIRLRTASETYHAKLDQVEDRKDNAQLGYEQQIYNTVNHCVAIARMPNNGDADGWKNACKRLANTTAAAARQLDISTQDAGQDGKTATRDFVDKVIQISQTLEYQGTRLSDARQEVQTALDKIEDLRLKATRSLAKAVYLASYESAEQVKYDIAVGALTNLAQKRYMQALQNAKVMSFFAKRAIEQRLGVTLREMHDELPLVAAPSSWEGDACSRGGIMGTPRYQKQGQPEEDWVAVYGEGFIGDYVDNLEKTVESYRLTQNFHEGNDIAVISLRDDVANVRTKCSLPSKNILRSSAKLDDASVWSARGCTPVEVSGVTEPAYNCIQAIACDGACENFRTPGGSKAPELAVLGQRGNQAGAIGYVMRYGDGKTCTDPLSPCGWSANAALSQIVTLSAGKYRLSWYTKDGFSAPTGVASGARLAAVALKAAMNPDGTMSEAPATPTNFQLPQGDSGAGTGWLRASVDITIARSGAYEVGFSSTQATRPTETDRVTIAAPMLEPIPSNGVVTTQRAFQSTDFHGMTTFDDCEDRDGVQFRKEHWNRQCAHLCKEGFSGNCTTGPVHCFQEFTFSVSQPWIAAGKLFKYSGFARGNFNYRIDSLGLNFVGTGIRDCSDSTLPSTCSNAGFVSYSVEHGGPFYILNHAGQDVRAQLFDGKIEHARGLALERYLTNPLSSTDRTLMADYMRAEFAGRPLDGSFTVRLWEEPNIDLNGVEDIQLILNYRYWTAND